VVVALAGSAGTALACDRDGARAANAVTFTTFQGAAGLHYGGWHGWNVRYDGSRIVTSYLGLTAAELKADLKAGQTLAQVANATPNKSAQGLVDALVAPWKTKLDAAVAASRITSAQETTILSHLNARFTALVNAHWPWWQHR
jgi:hypothetical protein